MKCISCDMEINPKWSHAIEINICPFCGQGIMEEHLKNLFSSLRVNMQQLQDYPDQLDDWMLSNHNYIKTNSPNINSFISKESITETVDPNKNEQLTPLSSEPGAVDKRFIVSVKTENGNEDIIAEKVQSEEDTNGFFTRAEAIKPRIEGFKNTAEKTKYLKEMAQKIKREGSTVINQAGLEDHLSSEMISAADPEAILEFEALMSSDSVSSALPSDANDDDIPSVVLAMANRAKGGAKDPNADLDKLHSQQSRAAESSKNFQTGTKGSFFRS